MLPFLLMIAVDDADLLATAREKLAAERRCVADPYSTDVTVCGLRNADRFRVPLVVHDPGDPRHEAVMAERVRMLHYTTPIEEMSPFLVGGGMAGVGVTSNADGTRAAGLRPLAP